MVKQECRYLSARISLPCHAKIGGEFQVIPSAKLNIAQTALRRFQEICAKMPRFNNNCPILMGGIHHNKRLLWTIIRATAILACDTGPVAESSPRRRQYFLPKQSLHKLRIQAGSEATLRPAPLKAAMKSLPHFYWRQPRSHCILHGGFDHQIVVFNVSIV